MARYSQDTAPLASDVPFTPAGGIAATDVKAAIEELDTEKSPVTRTINAQTGTTYTFVLADAGKVVTLSNTSAITATVPANGTAAFPVGTQIDVHQLGAGQVTFAAAGGVTINPSGTLKISGQHKAATLLKVATDSWQLIGALAA